MQVRSLGQDDPLEEGMATISSILAWRIPWTEEPGRLQSRGSQRGRHNWSNLACVRQYPRFSCEVHQLLGLVERYCSHRSLRKRFTQFWKKTKDFLLIHHIQMWRKPPACGGLDQASGWGAWRPPPQGVYGRGEATLWSHKDRFFVMQVFCFETSLTLLCVLSAGEVETALSRTPVSLSRSRLAKQDLIELLFPAQLPTYLPCISAFRPHIALGESSQTRK